MIKGTLSRSWACLPRPRKLERIAIFSSFSLMTNRIEIASTLEHTIVCIRHCHRISKRTPVSALVAVTYLSTDVRNLSYVESLGLNGSSEPTDQGYDMPDPVFSFIAALPNVGT